MSAMMKAGCAYRARPWTQFVSKEAGAAALVVAHSQGSISAGGGTYQGESLAEFVSRIAPIKSLEVDRSRARLTESSHAANSDEKREPLHSAQNTHRH